MQCFYCEKKCKKDNRNPRREYFRIVQKGNDLCEKTLNLCDSRQDKWSKGVERRLPSICDLVAAKARYHLNCRLDFERDNGKNKAGRPRSSGLDSTFEVVCAELENMEPLSVHDFNEKMEQINGEKYSNVYIKKKLIEKYGSKINFVQKNGKSDVIILDVVAVILADSWYEDRQVDVTQESKRIVLTAAKLIKDAIHNHDVNTTCYPVPDIENASNVVPELLTDFVSTICGDNVKAKALSLALFASCRRYSSIMPLQFALAVSIDHKFGSKWLNQVLYDFGFCVGYDEVVRFKQNVVAHEDVDLSASLSQSTFLQFVGDNTDHDLNTVDGFKTHHGLGSIQVWNGTFNPNVQNCAKIPRKPKLNWSNVANNEGIPILIYGKRMDIVLKNIELEPLTHPVASKLNEIDVVWVCNRLCKPDSPSWAGFMSLKSCVEQKPSSTVTMLPVIDLNSSDPNSLFSLLQFIVKQCEKQNIPETAVTFDQPLFLKAFEIVNAKSMPIFVRLGGFHQLMSFLGSIGFIMEGSGLREAFECVYAPISVGHMLSGEAYARAVCSHLMVSSALISIILEPYLNSLSEEELQEVLNASDNPSNPSIVRLMEFLEDEKARLKSDSRTAALWIQYMEYVSLAQDFIRAERTNDWLSHLDCTLRMLNLFAASGHMNYAKSG